MFGLSGLLRSEKCKYFDNRLSSQEMPKLPINQDFLVSSEIIKLNIPNANGVLFSSVALNALAAAV